MCSTQSHVNPTWAELAWLRVNLPWLDWLRLIWFDLTWRRPSCRHLRPQFEDPVKRRKEGKRRKEENWISSISLVDLVRDLFLLPPVNLWSVRPSVRPSVHLRKGLTDWGVSARSRTLKRCFNAYFWFDELCFFHFYSIDHKPGGQNVMYVLPDCNCQFVLALRFIFLIASLLSSVSQQAVRLPILK